MRRFSALQRAEIAEIMLRRQCTRQYKVEVSVLFNEPKLLKSPRARSKTKGGQASFSALQRAEIAEMYSRLMLLPPRTSVSVLFNEPKLLKFE